MLLHLPHICSIHIYRESQFWCSKSYFNNWWIVLISGLYHLKIIKKKSLKRLFSSTNTTILRFFTWWYESNNCLSVLYCWIYCKGHLKSATSIFSVSTVLACELSCNNEKRCVIYYLHNDSLFNSNLFVWGMSVCLCVMYTQPHIVWYDLWELIEYID